MNKIILLIVTLFFVLNGFSQNLDSLVQATQPEILPGKIVTYYTPGKKGVAEKLQALSMAVAAYYEKQFGYKFHVKLAVLDSAHWPVDMAPYGIIFSKKDWVFMHAGMSFESFQNVYGMQSFKSVTLKALRSKKMKGNDLVQSFLAFYTVHELGHYFLNKLSGAKYPDYFTNEWMASYFAFQFFKKNQPAVLPAFELFCQVYRDNVKPVHTSVASFNEQYGNDGIPTYGWYHVNFYFLCKAVWNCAGEKLIGHYSKVFQQKQAQKITPDEIIQKLELCKETLQPFEMKLNNGAISSF